MNGKTIASILARLSVKLRQAPSFLWRFEGRLKGVEFEGACEMLGRPLLSLAPDSRIVIGDGVRIYSSVRSNPLGCFQPCVLRAVSPGARLVVGRRVGLSGTVLCAAGSIEIGEGSIFGSGAMVIDNDFHVPEGEWGWRDDPDHCTAPASAIRIGRGVFVGARAVILKGVTIGDRAVVGAGAVVTEDVPAGHTSVGNPARSFLPRKPAH